MPLFRSSRRTGPAFMLQNGPFSPKPARLPFFKLIRAFRFASLHVTKTAGGFGRFCRFSPWRLFQRAVSPLPRNGPVLLPRKRQKWPKNHPPSLAPPQLVFFLASIAAAGVVRLANKHETPPHGVVGGIEWLCLEPLEPPFHIPSLQNISPLKQKPRSERRREPRIPARGRARAPAAVGRGHGVAQFEVKCIHFVGF